MLHNDYQISIEEYAAISADVYNPKEESKPPEGWRRFMGTDGYGDSNDTHLDSKKITDVSDTEHFGYFGALYYKKLPNNDLYLVMAHRGTANIQNLEDDLKLFFGDIHLVYARLACSMFYDFMTNFIDVFGTENIRQVHQTGHSLGAIGSDFTTMIYQGYVRYLDLSSPVCSITFENPGSKNYLLGIAEFVLRQELSESDKIKYMNIAQSNCYVYLSNTNMINTNNEQLNNCYRLTNIDYYFSHQQNNGSLFSYLFLSIPSDLTENTIPGYDHYYGNRYYMMNYTLDQHSIEKIHTYLKNGGSTENCKNPVGFQHGYIDYLNPGRKSYWEKYMDACWDSSKDLRKKYSDDKEKFKTEFMIGLDITYNKSKKAFKDHNTSYKSISSSGLSFFNINKEISEFVVLNNEETNDKSNENNKCLIM